MTEAQMKTAHMYEVGQTIARDDLPALRSLGETSFDDPEIFMDTPEPDDLDAFSCMLLKWADGTELFLNERSMRAFYRVCEEAGILTVLQWIHEEGSSLPFVFRVVD